MQHASRDQFGRPMAAVQPNGAPPEPRPAKWDLLDALTVAAADLGLNHRTLNVLRALLSFLPGPEIPADRAEAIVFPANRTLSARLNGMPESTLRRHLARLVELGLVSRHDSPNRKRYARRGGPGQGGDARVALVFGFDLTPLRQHGERIRAAARAARAREARLAILRDEVAVLRQQLIERAGEGAPPALMEEARLALRRKPDEAALTRLRGALDAELEQRAPADNPSADGLFSAIISANDDRNGRHIQDSDKPVSDSERPEKISGGQQMEGPEKPPAGHCHERHERAGEPNLPDVLDSCSELRALFPQPVRDWATLFEIVSRLAPMLGIDQPVLLQANRTMGTRQAALALVYILERHQHIRSPGAYLRSLIHKAEAGRFAILPLLNALGRGKTMEIVS
ncbi:plasmid replication protein RepC [Pontibaca methylaminivorans]|uniref:Replication initiation protein RepC n=1 Tax=Pontibaca methylaminivorans TaxID=515897 RepID=A0A1R3X6K9_9RHOB|nr:plasmid replication protein RepC [Pontibaca methylaminivorans]SIT86555.1 replication initiation protein RepC [Pontibaca methylaminivorans]